MANRKQNPSSTKVVLLITAKLTVNAEPEKVLEILTGPEIKALAPVLTSKRVDSKAALAPLKDKFFGKQWIEWRAIPSRAASVTYLSQTVFFSPRGLPGFLYWYLLYPFHLINFRGLIKSIARQIEK